MKLHRSGPSCEAISASETLPGFDRGRITDTMPGDSLKLLPSIKWENAFYTHWTPGEDGAWKSLQHFSDQNLLDYTAHRDRPALAGTSHLSPHLLFGEICPLQI
jgi:deoxyribodipyrimidine photo-lyase